MRYIALVVCIGIAACGNNAAPTFLEGKWKSDKTLTISNLTDNKHLTQEKRKFLVDNLGKLTLVFNGNKTSVYFDAPEDLEWGTFEIVESTSEGFTISITSSMLDNKKFQYRWAGDCFYLVQDSYGYNEYFCKQETGI